MYELGLLDEFQPHQKLAELDGVIDGQTVPIADFSRLPTHCKFIAFMPQWDFLNFLSSRATRFPSFELRMEHEVTDLLAENVDRRSSQSPAASRMAGCVDSTYASFHPSPRRHWS